MAGLLQTYWPPDLNWQRPAWLEEPLDEEPLDEEPLEELPEEELPLEELPEDERDADSVMQLMQYMASSSTYLPQLRQRLECVVQQFVSPEEAM